MTNQESFPETRRPWAVWFAYLFYFSYIANFAAWVVSPGSQDDAWHFNGLSEAMVLACVVLLAGAFRRPWKRYQYWVGALLLWGGTLPGAYNLCSLAFTLRGDEVMRSLWPMWGNAMALVAIYIWLSVAFTFGKASRRYFGFRVPAGYAPRPVPPWVPVAGVLAGALMFAVGFWAATDGRRGALARLGAAAGGTTLDFITRSQEVRNMEMLASELVLGGVAVLVVSVVTLRRLRKNPAALQPG